MTQPTTGPRHRLPGDVRTDPRAGGIQGRHVAQESPDSAAA